MQQRIITDILALGIIGGAVFLIISVLARFSRVEDSIEKNKRGTEKEILFIGEFYDNKLSKMDVPSGVNVVIFKPKDSRWNNRSEYVARHIEQLIGNMDNCLICGSACRPVCVGVYPMRWFGGVTIRPHADAAEKGNHLAIIFSVNTMKSSMSNLDDIIAHECAHLLVCESQDEHGDDWEFYYKTFRKKLKQEPLPDKI